MPENQPPIPAHLRGRAFTTQSGLREGITEWRLQRPDLRRPFYGVRAPIQPELKGQNTHELYRANMLRLCDDYSPRLRPGQFFSHQTAAAIWGIPLPSYLSDPYERPLLHVSALAPRQAPRTRGVRGYRAHDPEIRLTTRNGLVVADPATTWLNLAAATRIRNGKKVPLFSHYDLVAAADHLVQIPVSIGHDGDGHRPLSTIAELTARTELFHGKGKQRASLALPFVRVGSESRMESILRMQIIDSGLPEPQLNLSITDASGIFIGRADLVYPEFRVIVEYDGDQHRTDPVQYEKDIDRVEKFQTAGWTFIRVRFSGLFGGFEKTRRRVEAALREAGWTLG